MRKHLSSLTVVLALTLFSLGVEAAVCTSQNAGNWNSSGTWDCGHVPFSSDTVVIAHNVTLNTSDTVAGLTINPGVTLTATNNDDLTVNGSIVNNGTYTSNGERLYMTGAGATLSGTGTFNDTRLYIDATNITLTAGSTMNFAGGANIRVGNNNDGSLTIAGTITDVGQPPGDRILRLDNNNPSSVTITGNLNTPNSYVEIQDGGTLTNNGSATIQYLDSNGDNGSTWTQGTNSNLTMTAPAQGWAGTFNASAPGNTVSYDGNATPLTPSNNTYYNLDGTYFDSPGNCPTTFTVLGTSPCDAASGTGAASTASGTCTSDPSNGGSYAWSGLNNVGASDDSHAQADGRSGSITEYLKCTGYNFNIPTDAIITGIELSIELHSESNRYFYDNFVHLVKNNTVQTATNKGTGTDLRANSDMVLSYGAPTDLWGGSWTPADFNSTSFGAAFAAQRGNFNNTGTVFVDTMPITVHYTLPSGSGPVPTASYSMDEAAWNGTSGEVADSIGTSNGTSFNGANTIATGKICRAGSFDGINDYVEVPNLSAKLSGTASLAFWINTTQTGNDTAWMAPGVTGVELVASANDIFWGWLDASGRIGISVGNDNTSKSTIPVRDGTWHHVVLTRDATNGAYKIYIDGSLNKSGTGASGVIGTAFSSIGRIEDTGGSPEYLQGELDEVLIFDSVLSDAEVVAGYNNQAAGNNWDGSAHTCPGTGPTPTCSTFADTFSTVSYANDDGTVPWADNWSETGDDKNGLPNQGAIQINNNRLQFGRANTGLLGTLLDIFGNNAPYIRRGANLTSYTTASLSFDLAGSGGLEATGRNKDTFEIKGSADGGTTWQSIVQFAGPQAATTYTYDISDYAGGSFQLALSGKLSGGNEAYYIDNLQIEACGVSGPDHFRFYHNGSGLTCNPEDIVVKACMDAACNTPYPDPITATFSPTGWVGGDTQTFASGDTLQLWYKTAGTATLDIASIVGAANPPRCFVGGVEQANCDMVFYDSGFMFDVPHHAAASLQTVALAAVRTDLTTQQCVPTFQGVTKPVNFWSTYNNPGNGSQAVNINGTDVATASPGTALNLAFDANGETVLSVSYPDAGNMLLDAQYTGTGEEAGLVMVGQDSFTAKPASFRVTITGNPEAADAAGAPFMKAGEAFPVTLEALNSNGALTPNFGNESPLESALLGAPSWLAGTSYAAGAYVVPTTFTGFTYEAVTGGTSAATEPAWPVSGGATITDGGVTWKAHSGYMPSLVSPVAGVNKPLTQSFTFSNGSATGTVSWPEVGIIQLTPHILDGDYLGAGDVLGTTTPNVGRFYPHHFTTAVTAGDFANACASCPTPFTYLGQGFGYGTAPAVVATAAALDGATTGNYTGSYARLGTGGVTLSYPTTDNTQPDQDGVNPIQVNHPSSSLARSDNGDGTLTFTLNDTFAYDRSLGEVGPFNADLTIQLTAVTDGEASANDLATATDIKPIATSNWQRYGRAVLADTYGDSANGTVLPLPLALQYYDGADFIPNTDDTATVFSTADLGCTEGSGGVTCVGIGVTGDAVGHGDSYTLTADDSTGTLLYTLLLGAEDYLQYDWNEDGTATNPVASATFGIYRGDDRFLYWREAEQP